MYWRNGEIWLKEGDSWSFVMEESKECARKLACRFEIPIYIKGEDANQIVDNRRYAGHLGKGEN